MPRNSSSSVYSTSSTMLSSSHQCQLEWLSVAKCAREGCAVSITRPLDIGWLETQKGLQKTLAKRIGSAFSSRRANSTTVAPSTNCRLRFSVHSWATTRPSGCGISSLSGNTHRGQSLATAVSPSATSKESFCGVAADASGAVTWPSGVSAPWAAAAGARSPAASALPAPSRIVQPAAAPAIGPGP